MATDLPDWSSSFSQTYTVPTFIASAYGTSNTSTVTASLPSAAVADDLILFAFATTLAAGPTGGFPSGTKQLLSGVRLYVYSYGASGGEQDFTIDVTSGFSWIMGVLQYRNAAVGPYLDIVTGTSAIVTVVPDKLPWVYALFSAGYAASGASALPATPTGFVEHISQQYGATPGTSLWCGDVQYGTLSSEAATITSAEQYGAWGLQV